ncbi:hypothetical protein RintRC_5157 [Richelia intracellularis]|nr:hypothetical protein RintRC_5157 [Richelia intracellularis]
MIVQQNNYNYLTIYKILTLLNKGIILLNVQRFINGFKR